MNTTPTATTHAVSQITFTPVNVNRGRKFRGFAYLVGDETPVDVAWNMTVWNSKLWDPAQKRYVYANSNFCEVDESVPASKIEADRDEYIFGTIRNTIDWCRSKSNGDEAEVKRFARNVLLKNHPDMLEDIDAVLPDERDVNKEIAETLKWADGLTTRACYMYGHHCAGGKPLSPKAKMERAYSALQRRGVTKLPGFEEAWNKIAK